ncbi:hypothetical protein Bca4012_009967 [Brassica carinata]
MVDQSSGYGPDAMEEEPWWLGEHGGYLRCSCETRSGVTEHKTGEGRELKSRGCRDRRAEELRWRFLKLEPTKE